MTAAAAGVAVALFAVVAFGTQFGILGIPVALTVLYAILVPVFWAFLIKPTCDAGFVEYHKVLALPTVTTACASLAAGAALGFVDGAILRILAAGAAGGVAYLIASWIFNREWLISMSELLMIKGKFSSGLSL